MALKNLSYSIVSRYVFSALTNKKEVLKRKVVLKKITNNKVRQTRMFDLALDSLEDLRLLLSRFFDYSEDIVVVVDSDDKVVYLNPSFLQQTKLTSEQAIGQNFARMCTENVSIGFYGQVTKKVMNARKVTKLSRIINVVDGLYDLVTVSPIVTKTQAVLGAMLIGKQVVLEQPLTEQALRRSAVYQKTMMDSIPFMMWFKDKDSRILAANTAYAELVGIEDARMLEGKTDLDFWPKGLAKGYIEDDLKVIDTGEPVSFVEKVKGPNEIVGWYETYKAPVVVDGEAVGTVGYARDVSEQKNLLSAIHQKDFQLGALLMSLPLSIIRYDTDCKRVFVNASKHDFMIDDAHVLLGKTPMEMWNFNIKNVSAEEYQAKLMYVLYHGESQTFEMHCEVDDQTIVNMVSLLPELDERHQVVGAIAIANNVTEISKYRHDLEYLAFHDALTSLPNRTLLNQKLHAAAAQGKRFGLMFMDLDFFKVINDTLGHMVGDELLIDAAKRITAAVRSEDVVARIGGDEFAILVTNLKSDEDLGGLAGKIGEKLSAPFNIEGINFFVTASIGIASYPADSEEVEDLIKYADTAMYDAKKQGRNNYQYYTPELTQSAMEHLAIATALRYAIKKDELSLQYQPKVNIATKRIIGVEALLRWSGKVLGQIQPDKFIPIAEESGLIVEIGAWVLKSSCEVAVQLNRNRMEPLNIAVNVSSKEFVGNDYIGNLQRCLAETGCKSEWLTLEITESLLLQDSGQELETLIAIDEMGINLSIDDFGTGYSALSYLSKFPISEVKIDRSFVMDICTAQSAALLIKAIIAMTYSLNKELVAEGIETDEQAALLKEYGCHQAQGYLYSKPVSFAELMHLLEQQKNY